MARLHDGLVREWEPLAARPKRSVLLSRWAAEDDRLAGFDSPTQVMGFVRGKPSARAANDLLAALIRGADNRAARRCALEAFMPGLVRLTGHYPSAGQDPDDRLQKILILDIERIPQLAGQDLEWPAPAVTDLVWDRLRRRVGRPPAKRMLPMEVALSVSAPPERSAAERLAGLLVAGLRQGSIRRDDAALIYTTRVAGHPTATVAAAVGVDALALRTRRRRAEQRLAWSSMSVC